MVLARILSWAYDRGLTTANPCERGGRLYHGSRADKIWTADDEAAFLARASKQLQLAYIFGVWSGQRQGDLLRQPCRVPTAALKSVSANPRRVHGL